MMLKKGRSPVCNTSTAHTVSTWTRHLNESTKMNLLQSRASTPRTSSDMLTRGQFTLQQYTSVMHLFAMHAPSRGDAVNSSSPRSMASHRAAASLSVGTSGFRDFQSAARATECRTAKQKSAYNCGTILRDKTFVLSRRCPEAKVVIKRSGKNRSPPQICC